MRAEFAQAIVELSASRPNLVFITGDLGYMALEKVAETLGGRFINAGVSEQNTMALAAGLAHEKFLPWVYSIAPFALLRPYEQIRNDICLHNLPVKIVGNGGGYGYGIMGATHHALEDIGVMRVLPHMKVYVPLTAPDVAEAVQAMAGDPSPNYLRLNLAARLPGPAASFAQWRRIKAGRKCVLIGTGPVLGNVLELEEKELLEDIEIWSIGILPVHDLPPALAESVREKKRVVTIEEHYGQCGIGETLARLLLKEGCGVMRYGTIAAQGYPSGRYGSQRWHQEESGLAGALLISRLKEVVYA